MDLLSEVFVGCSSQRKNEDTDLARWTISPDGDPKKATQLRKDGGIAGWRAFQKKMAGCVYHP